MPSGLQLHVSPMGMVMDVLWFSYVDLMRYPPRRKALATSPILKTCFGGATHTTCGIAVTVAADSSSDPVCNRWRILHPNSSLNSVSVSNPLIWQKGAGVLSPWPHRRTVIVPSVHDIFVYLRTFFILPRAFAGFVFSHDNL